MLSYLTTDACSIFGFLIRRPLNVADPSVDSKIAWQLSRYQSVCEVDSNVRSFVS